MRALALLAACTALAAGAQAPDTQALIAAQKEAMKAFAAMNGVWRGPAWTIVPGGRKIELIQTERAGPMLDGTLKVVEGRGYLADGTLGFNAFGVISYSVATKQYAMRSWAMGQSGEFAITPTADGYVWERPAGPGAVIRYTASVKGDTFSEHGEFIAGDKPPSRIFEMTLKRVGDTAWPAGDPILPR